MDLIVTLAPTLLRRQYLANFHRRENLNQHPLKFRQIFAAQLCKPDDRVKPLHEFAPRRGQEKLVSRSSEQDGS